MYRIRINQKITGRYGKYICMAMLIMSMGMLVGCAPRNNRNTAESTTNAQSDQTQTVEVTTQESTQAVTTTEEPTTATSDYASISNEKYAWWFMRTKDHTQPGCQQDFDVTQYDGYYVSPDSESKVIYLTFDCGYENGFTPSILDTLKSEGVHAMFFVTKPFIKDNADLVKRMKEEGHMVGNHTVHHPSMPDLSVDEVKSEVLDCQAYMKEQTGYDMDHFIRPPKGEYSERTLQVCKDLGYKTIFWSIAYLDYDTKNQPGAGYVLEQFKNNHHPGAIPLIHNVSESNAQALPKVIAFLKSEGYTFGTLDQLGQ